MRYRHHVVVSTMRRACKRILLISLIASTCLHDVIDAVTTSPSPSNEQPLTHDDELFVALMMPRTGELGFERNAAASTLAIDQAHQDGLLAGVNVRSACQL